MQLIRRKTQQIGDSFLEDCRYRKLSPKTLRGYIDHVNRLTTLSKWFPPKPEIVQQCLADFTGIHNADAYYRTWHALGSYAEKRYKIPNFMGKVTRPKVPRQIMPTLTATQLNSLATLLRDAPLRDKAILTLFIDTAVRNGEACNLRRGDILEDRIIVRGKTGYRVAPLSSITREFLLALPVHEDGYIFHGRLGKPLGSTGFYKVVKRYLLKVAYRGKQFGAQTLRRSFGRFHLLDGGDMQSLSLILGHKNITTTANYYAPLLAEDVIKIHHRHTPGRVFERGQELAVTQSSELRERG